MNIYLGCLLSGNLDAVVLTWPSQVHFAGMVLTIGGDFDVAGGEVWPTGLVVRYGPRR